MPIVKELFIRLKTDGAAAAKHDMDDVAARAREVGNLDPTIRMSVDDRAASFKLRAIRLELDAVGKDSRKAEDAARRIREIGEAADSSSLKLAALRLEMAALRTGGGSSGGGLFGMLRRGIGSAFSWGNFTSRLGAANGFLGNAGVMVSNPYGLGILGGGVAAAASSGALGILPLLLAGGMGLGSLGALGFGTVKGAFGAASSVNSAQDIYQLASRNLGTAVKRSPADMKDYQSALAGLEPHLRTAAELLTNQGVQWQKLSPAMQKNVIALSNNKTALKGLLPDQKAALTALLGQQKAWQDLSPGQQGAVKGLQSLSDVWGKATKALAPDVFKIFNEGLRIAGKLLPDMVPFAKTAATAIDGLLKGFDKFASSPGFKQFLAQMLKMSGPAITAIGTGIGQIVIAFGKLMLAFANPNGIRALRALFDTVAWAMTGIAWFFNKNTPLMLRLFHLMAVGFDNVRHWAAVFGHGVAVAFDAVRHALAWLGDHFVHWYLVADHAVNNVIGFFGRLPGRIRSELASLPGELFSIGRSIATGLVHGMESIPVLGPVIKWGTSIIGSISSHLGIRSPSTVMFGIGANVGQGLVDGMASKIAAVQAEGLALGRAAAAGVTEGMQQISDLAAEKRGMFAHMSGSMPGAVPVNISFGGGGGGVIPYTGGGGGGGSGGGGGGGGGGGRHAAHALSAAALAAQKVFQALLQHVQAIQAFIRQTAQAQVAWAGLAGAMTGVAYTHYGPGKPGSTVYSHLTGGVTTGGTAGNPEPTAKGMLRNMRMDLGRLRAFAGVLKRLQRMGLDKTLMNQIIAAGPDQGYQIAEAILDAGRAGVREFNRTESAIQGAGNAIGKTAARSNFRGGHAQVIINFPHLLAGNPTQIAREIQKILSELKRHNGGAALGLS